MHEGLRAFTMFSASIVGLALVSVILSQRANTTAVINSGGSAFAGLISTATGAVTQ